MATVAVPADTTVTLDPGTGYALMVVNSGSQNLRVAGATLIPGAQQMVYPAGFQPVTALSTTGVDGQVTVTVYGGSSGTVDGGSP